MNAYQIALATGGTTIISAEDYNSDPVAGLTFMDQFGNVVASYKPGVWLDVAIVNPTAPGTAASNSYQSAVSASSPGVVPTLLDGTYNDGNL